MRTIFVLAFSLGWNANALLSGQASEVEKDLPRLSHRSISKQENPTDCYSFKIIDGDGVGVKEYINRASNTVFMIRSSSRVMMSIQTLLKSDDFSEFQHAKKVGTQAVRTVTRNHRSAITETPRLRVLFDDTQMVHRSIVISKSDVPSCVTSPETLP